MANHTYNTARPATGDPANTTRTGGGTISSGIVQVIIDDSASKLEVLQALEAIEMKITAANWPPTGA